MMQRIKVVVAVLLIAVIALCATLASGKLLGRARVADLTQDNLYSLSGGTQNILRKLNQPVTLKLYYSRESAQKGPEGIRFWNTYFLYVRDILEEYVSRSNGMVRLEVLDPKTYSEQEEQAVACGLKRFDLQDNSFLFGLVATTELGKEKSIPFFEPQRQTFVEYDVSKLLSDLTRPDKRSVGVLSSIPVMGDNYPPYMMMMLQQQGKTPKQAWGVIQELKESYDVFEAKVKDGVFERVPDYLLIVQPKKLDQGTLFAVDQYLVNGGKAAVFVDPYCFSDQPQMSMYQQPDPAASSSELNELLAKWGVSMDVTKIVADPELAQKVPLEQGRPAEPFLPFLGLGDKNLDLKQAVVAQLHKLQMVYAGELALKPVDGLTQQPLIFSSPEGNLWKPEAMDLMRPPSFAKLMRALQPENRGVKTLAVLLSGTFKSNFPDGVELMPQPEKEEGPQNPMMNPMMMNGMGFSGDGPAAPAGAGEGAAAATAPGGNDPKDGKAAAPQPIKRTAVKEGKEPGMLIVTSDVDMISDQLAFRNNQFGGMMENGDNASYVMNILDFLGGSYDLMSVRTRQEYLRPFKVVDEIEREAEKASAGKIEELNDGIQKMRKQISDLADSQGGKNTELLQKNIIEKRRDLEGQVIRANRELRKLQQEKRDAVSLLQHKLLGLNALLAPFVVALIGLLVWLHRRTLRA